MVNNKYWRTGERKSVSFERMQPQYFLNKQGRLEESPIMIDTQEKINSVEYTKLDEIYDKFLIMDRERNSVYDGGEMVVERESLEDDLSRMMEIDAIRDRYATENTEVANMSIGDMINYVNGKLSAKNDEIKDYVNNRDKENNNAENIEKKSE